MQRAFVIRPFGKKTDRAGREIDFEEVSAVLIEPALRAAGLGGGTTGEIIEAGNIREDMFGLILEADVVVCDMTNTTPTSFMSLESGMRCVGTARSSSEGSPRPMTSPSTI